MEKTSMILVLLWIVSEYDMKWVSYHNCPSKYICYVFQSGPLLGGATGAVVPVHFEELVYKKWGLWVSKMPPRPRFFFRAGTFKILTTALFIYRHIRIVLDHFWT